MKSIFKFLARFFKKDKRKTLNAGISVTGGICTKNSPDTRYYSPYIWEYEGYARCGGFRTTEVKWIKNPFL